MLGIQECSEHQVDRFVDASPGTPRVWVLAGDKAGDNAQCVTIARALGLPFAVKHLRYTQLFRLWNLILGASIVSLDRRRSDPLCPPWPELVIAAGRRSVPVARWIRRQAGGRTRLVQIGRPRAPLGLFDLIVTTPQYGLPARDNILHLATPVTSPPRVDAAEAGLWESRFAALPRPWIALLVGGDARPYRFDPNSATRLASIANDMAARCGGSLLVSTSRRTAPASARALAAALRAPHYLHRFGEPENPYMAYLAFADAFIVTADSASMLADACATERPVFLYELPRRGARKAKYTQAIIGAAGSWGRRLRDWGILYPPRELATMHARLLADGRLKRLVLEESRIDRVVFRPGDAGRPSADLDSVVARIHALLSHDRQESQHRRT